MADDRKDLPPITAPNFLERVREVLSVYLGNRGDVLNRGVTLRDMVDGGLATLDARFAGGGKWVTPLVPVSTVTAQASDATSDMTPPPTPTGFTATAGLTNIFLEHDTPFYSQGHGHSHTEVWGSTLELPTFSQAVKLTEFTGTVFAFPSNLNTAWHLWAKWVSVDGVASVTAAGGTNGVSATTGKIGTADLNPLIVQAENLAAGAVDATKFVSTIEPVTLVLSGSLPTVKSTNTIYFVPDRKLYRWNDTAYVSSIPAVDVTGTLSDSQLAAISAAKVTGTLSDAQLAAISAAKVTGQITGTQITDSAITTAKIGAGAITTAKIAAGAVTAGEIAAGAITASKIGAGEITAGKIAAGAIVAGDIAAGAITTAKLASGAVTANEIAAAAITTGKIAANAVTAGEIAAGAITAGKIAANAIAVGSAAIENGAIVNAMIANATIDSAKIVSLGVSQLTAGSLTAGQYIRSTSYVPGTSGWSINADGSAELSNVTVRGAVYASSGTFAGSLSGATGTFSGSLSAASGTFTGILSGATGTFAGSLSAASGTFAGAINVGAFTGYSWPAAGLSGAHLSSAGLLIGNYNGGGKYLQVACDATGAVISTNIPAHLEDLQVSTIKIANNAATLTSSAFTASAYRNTLGATWQDAQSLTITTTGAQVYVSSAGVDLLGTWVSGENTGEFPPQFRLVRGATVLMNGLVAMSYSETPPAGAHTYALQVYSDTSQGSIGTNAGASNRSLFAIETKR